MRRDKRQIHSDVVVTVFFFVVLLLLAGFALYAKFFGLERSLHVKPYIATDAIDEIHQQIPEKPSAYLPTVDTKVTEEEESQAERPVVAGVSVENQFKPGIIVSEPKSPQTVATRCSQKTFAETMLCYINMERKKQNVPLLTMSGELSLLSYQHAQWMFQTKTLSHYESDGSTPAERCRAAGVRCYGENLARGTSDAEKIVALWLANVEHRHIMLNSNYFEIGVGIEGGYVSALFN